MLLLAFMSINFNKSYADNNHNIPNVSERNYNKNVKNINKIRYEELKKKINRKKSFILFIGYKECKYCRASSHLLKRFNNIYHKKFFYLDLDKISHKDIKNGFYKFANYKLKLFATPTIMPIKNGKINYKFSFVGYGFTMKNLKFIYSKISY